MQRTITAQWVCLSVISTILIAPPATVAETDNTTSKTKHLDSVVHRFEKPAAETPDFQRHISPLLGRLGCNGRACHGSFQGRGGFRLSLFGFDFDSDYQALLEDGHFRVDVDDPSESLILTKPTDEDMHDGGLRYEVDSWQYNLLKGWIKGGAKSSSIEQDLVGLEIRPQEVHASWDRPVQLQVIAQWNDGTSEDVTPLSRFQSKDPQIANVSEGGVVSSGMSGDTHVIVFYDNAVMPVPVIHAIQNETQINFPTPTRIDELVKEKFDKLGLQPSQLSDDAMFLRRVSLDIAGTLPSPTEIERFLKDPDPDKRAKKIDELLETPAYVSWWTTFFCDLTGNNSQQLRNVAAYNNVASLQWYQWLRQRIKENVPYDQMVEGIVMAVSRNENEGYIEYCERMSSVNRGDSEQEAFADASSMPYYWMRREFRTGETRAISFAHAFMGIRVQCAQCHKHPFDQWTQEDFQQFSRFFTGVAARQPQQVAREERADLAKLYEDLGINPREMRGGNLRRALVQAARQGKTVPVPELVVTPPRDSGRRPDGQRRRQRRRVYTDAILLGSNAVDLTEFTDVREPVMKWLRQKDNPYFSKAIVNRVWARYFGVGIVEPADDLNLANPPSNAALLEYLANSFVENGYDLKWLHREIANSRTYQLSWQTNEMNRNDRRNFSRALPRRLPAEVVFDAVVQATSNDERNAEFLNAVDRRAISLPGTDFNRRRGRDGNPGFALSVFGKSERLSNCDCDRSEETSLIQTVYLQNDRDIHNLLSQPNSWIRQFQPSAGSGELSKNERDRLKQIERRLQGMKAKRRQLLRNGNENAANQLTNNIRAIEKRVQPYRKRRNQETSVVKDEWKPRDFVVQAYLRTLSRHPTESELTECLEFIKDGDDVVDSATGVLWALINTKEFIVNH